MPRHLYSVFCDYILTDSVTNLVSYIRCVEEVTAPKFPINLSDFSISILLQRSYEDEKISLKVSVRSPYGKETNIINVDEFIFTKTRQRFNIEVQSLLIESPGVHEFVIESYDKKEKGWKTLHSYPLVVKEEDQNNKGHHLSMMSPETTPSGSG